MRHISRCVSAAALIFGGAGACRMNVDSIVDGPEEADGQALVTTAASTTPRLLCDSVTTLRGLVNCIFAKMPRAESEGFVVPTEAERSAWRGVVSSMLAGRCDAGALPPSLAATMALRWFTDAGNGKTYCALLEVTDGDRDGYVDKGWGTFIVDPEAERELSQQAPHPGADLTTEVQAVEVFKATASRSFLMCGAHRAANSTPSSCAPSYGSADCAHATATMFYATAQEIDAYYRARAMIHTQVQWHGMATSTCPSVDVHIAEGIGTAPAPGSNIPRLRANLERYHPGWRVNDPSSSLCGLNAVGNVEGRFLNTGNPAAACEHGPSTASGRFVSIEQKLSFRSASAWAAAIIDSWGP